VKRLGMLLALALSSCPAPQTVLDLGPSGQSCAPPTADVGGPPDSPDTGYNLVSCVNFLEFKVDNSGEFSTHCIKLTQEILSLCDLKLVADGRELFKIDPNSEVKISVRGLRVFPATSCDVDPTSTCQNRVIFAGSTDLVRIGDLVGGLLELPVTVSEPCGPPEQWFEKGDQSCADICDVVVCDGIQGGCLCRGVK
jgi:hypothetical protein